MSGLRFSVIIPALNEAASIAETVAGVRAQGFTQIIVADGGSTDGTAMLARRAGAAVLTVERGRAAQMNGGAGAADGDLLIFLHADTRLPDDARELLGAACSDPAVVGGCFRLKFDLPHPVLTFSAWCTRFETGLTTWGDQAYFVRRDVFERIGGFPLQPLMEDLELRRRLKAVGRFVKLPAAVVTSARRFQKRGVLRQQALNGALVAAYRLGVPAERLQRYYR